MSNQRQRKRSLSDIPHLASPGDQQQSVSEIQPSSKVKINDSIINPGQSEAIPNDNSITEQPKSSKKRRNTNDRQARLLTFPVYCNYPSQLQYQGYYSQQYVPQNNPYSMFPQVQEPKPPNQARPEQINEIGATNIPKMSQSQVPSLNPNFYENRQLSPFPSMPMTQQHLQMEMQRQQSQNTPITQMRVLNNSIVFSLYPNSSPSFNFMIDGINPEGKPDNFIRKKVILSSTMISNITFILNQVPFLNCDLPIDLTNWIINGQNYIYFLTVNFVQPVFVHLKIDQIDIDFLVQNIILNMQYHQGSVNEIPIDPFASQLDPVTKKRIEIAVRGYVCQHYQCFDLRSFAERAISTTDWSCPICGKPLSPDMLRLYPDYVRIQDTHHSIFQTPGVIPEMEHPTMFQMEPNVVNGPSSAPTPTIPEINHNETNIVDDDVFKEFLNDDDVFQHDHFF